MADKLVLAYSGGLDTSVAVRWIKERYGYDVVTLTADLGNAGDLGVIAQRARAAGAIAAHVADVREEFLRDFAFRALQAGAIYQGAYPLATALGRPLIARLLVEAAHAEGATAVAHGCTGKGNDQVRFDVSVGALAPHLKVIAPAREWGMTREEEIDYAARHGIPVPVTKSKPFSTDENLWGRSIESGVLEDPWQEPPEEAYQWTKPVAQTPDKPRYVEIRFEQGTPLAVDGEDLSPVALVQHLDEAAGEHGVGRIDHIEDRLVGIKSREIYEAPAATVLMAAHRALEAMVLTKDQLRFKEVVAREYAQLVYDGLWFSRQREDLQAYVESTQRFVTGAVRVKLSKGQATVVGRQSPYSLYQTALATYGKGDLFDQSASPGFIHIWGLSTRTQARVQEKNPRPQK
ncbi:MAG: argininosuccinate synthase [Chloroflexi bacterium]|nr:argininosuccinate synthase [Chloroflexota bacterium]